MLAISLLFLKYGFLFDTFLFKIALHIGNFVFEAIELFMELLVLGEFLVVVFIVFAESPWLVFGRVGASRTRSELLKQSAMRVTPHQCRLVALVGAAVHQVVVVPGVEFVIMITFDT